MSSFIFVFYGFYILSTGIRADPPHDIVENVLVKEEMAKGESETHDDLLPIVLVHGYFGFGSFAERVSPMSSFALFRP